MQKPMQMELGQELSFQLGRAMESNRRTLELIESHRVYIQEARKFI